MAYMNMVFKGATSSKLYTAYFDSERWHGNRKIEDQPGQISPRSSYNPGACLYNNRLYIVYKADNSDHLYMAYYDGLKWYGDKPISTWPGSVDPRSDRNPSLIVFNNLMYAVYKSSIDNNIYVAWFDGTQWFGNTRIGTMPGNIGSQTDRGIDLVAFEDKLYLVYKGATTHELYTAWFDGETWGGDTRIKHQPGGISPESDDNPGTVVFNGLLYIVYKGATSNHLYTAWFDGNKWYGNTKIKDQKGGIDPESNYCPRALVFNNRFYVVYKGAHSDALYSASYDGQRWHGNTKIEDQPGGISPDCNYNPELTFLPTAPAESGQRF